METKLGKSLIDWYLENKRDLPWRHTTDAYKIWLSEVILQQTRVAQGLDYYNKFVTHYPTVDLLASAPEDEVLRLWQGLGYYNRARNLQKAARQVVDDHGSQFPTAYATLLTLPGIGDYTAAAVASFSNNEKVGVVDGNVLRVICRYLGIYDDIGKQSTRKQIQQIVNSVVQQVPSHEFNQAIMEFGALQCVPKNPNCLQCPLQDACVAFANKTVPELPVKEKKTKVRDRYLCYIVVENEGKLLLRQRGTDGIWAKLYEFIAVESEAKTALLEEVDNQIHQWTTESYTLLEKEYKHVLSHQRLHVRFAVVQASSLHLEGYKWYTLAQVKKLPKPVLIDNFLHDLYF